MTVSTSIKIKIPENIQSYLYDYSHSKFIECNHELSKLNFKLSNGSYNQNLTRNKLIMPCMNQIVSIMESMHKSYWLSSGSLLGILDFKNCFFISTYYNTGWYRDCGIVPHTTDMDIAMMSDQYDSKLHKSLVKHKDIYIWLAVGRKKNSLETRLGGCKFGYDIFLVYELSKNKYCNFYHGDQVIP